MNTIHVAAAAILNQLGSVLLSRRHKDTHQGGLWEFPGGKLENGESVATALYRELQEELGIQVTEHRPLIRVRHDYPDRRVVLDVHLVSGWKGEPAGLEKQPVRWVDLEELEAYSMPAADVPIVSALQLPSVYMITRPQVDDPTQFIDHLRHMLEQGVRLIQYRVFGLERKQHITLAQRTLTLCREYGAQLLVNSDVQLVKHIDAHGVHLTGRQLRDLDTRPLPNHQLVSASCHSPRELQRACQLGADFAVLSPVMTTQSHPNADLLGWEGFARMVEKANMPVYALGGMQLGHLQQAWASGAQGVSGIRMELNSMKRK